MLHSWNGAARRVRNEKFTYVLIYSKIFHIPHSSLCFEYFSNVFFCSEDSEGVALFLMWEVISC